MLKSIIYATLLLIVTSCSSTYKYYNKSEFGSELLVVNERTNEFKFLRTTQENHFFNEGNVVVRQDTIDLIFTTNLGDSRCLPVHQDSVDMRFEFSKIPADSIVLQLNDKHPILLSQVYIYDREGQLLFSQPTDYNGVVMLSKDFLGKRVELFCSSYSGFTLDIPESNTAAIVIELRKNSSYEMESPSSDVIVITGLKSSFQYLPQKKNHNRIKPSCGTRFYEVVNKK